MLDRLRGLFRDNGGPAENVEDVVDTLPPQTTTAPIADVDLIGAQGDTRSHEATQAWLASDEGKRFMADHQ